MSEQTLATVQTVHRKQAIPASVIEECIEDYLARDAYDTELMNKASPGDSLRVLAPFCQQAVPDLKLEYRSGNFYRHTYPYLPHTDYKPYNQNTVNVVIPLLWKTFDREPPSLFVFDQMWRYDSVTWCMHHRVLPFETNTGVKGAPWEYPVEGLTGQPFDEVKRAKFLPHYTTADLQSLSGEAYPFEVGSILVFDNRRIHATSWFVGEKLGISLRFKVKNA